MEIRYLISTHCLIMLYTCTKFGQSISKGFRDTDLDSRVDARVVANVDRHMDGHMNGRKTGSLYHAMPEAGMTKMGEKHGGLPIDLNNRFCRPNRQKVIAD